MNAVFTWGTQCTAAGWASLESAGCVFLPAAGRRYHMNVYDVGGEGACWSSSSRNVNAAWAVTFLSGSVYSQGNLRRSEGFSVRLVKAAE